MAFSIYQKITIANFHFSRSNGVEMHKSTNTIGSTAKIKVPISAVLENKGERSGLVEVQKAIKVGDPVRILLGYHNKKQNYENVEFNGFVKRINPTIPLEIECEDNNYLLRKNKINKSWKKTTLQEVLNVVIKGTGVELSGNIPQLELSPFYLKNVDGAFTLQKLADEYGLTAYFKKDGSLYVGLAYTEETGKVTLILNGDDSNVVNADDLKFRNKEDVKLKIKAVAIQGNNTKIETELGDEGGAQRTLNFYNIKTVEELKTIAQQEMDKLKFDGYEGKVKCLLIPFVEPGFTATIKDEIFPDRDGDYFVESVSVTYGMEGIRRKIELGIKV